MGSSFLIRACLRVAQKSAEKRFTGMIYATLISMTKAQKGETAGFTPGKQAKLHLACLIKSLVRGKVKRAGFYLNGIRRACLLL